MTALETWWLRNPGSVDQEQHDWHLREVDRAERLIGHGAQTST